MPVTIEQARGAKLKLYQLKARLPIVGVGLAKRGPDYVIKINLSKQIAEEMLPDSCAGVPLVYEVVGELKKRI